MSDIGLIVDLDELIGCENNIRKLIGLVLLCAVKERASEVRLKAIKHGCLSLSYTVNGVSFEMVPPPRHMEPEIIATLFELCREPAQTHCSWKARLAQSLRQWAERLERHWSGGRWYDFSWRSSAEEGFAQIRVHPRPGRRELVIALDPPTEATARTALKILEEFREKCADRTGA